MSVGITANIAFTNVLNKKEQQQININLKLNKMAKKKNVGFNYLHRHPQTETSLNLDIEHVIVDRKEWEEVVDYFHQYPEEVEKLGKSRYTITGS